MTRRRYDDARDVFLIRNSWGNAWGDGGYCTMPYAYLVDSNLSDDFWTITLVEVVPPASRAGGRGLRASHGGRPPASPAGGRGLTCLAWGLGPPAFAGGGPGA